MDKETADRILAKVRDDYDTIADDFSATREALSWPETAGFADLVRPGARVLDIGCGNGRAYKLYEGKAIAYLGIDVSERLVAHARRLVLDPLADFAVGSILDIPAEDGSFDQVVAVAMLHHIPSAAYHRKALAEVARVLKPGGTFCMTNWSRWRPSDAKHHLAALGRWLAGTGYGPCDLLIRWDRGPQKVRRYYHAFTRGGLERMCRRAGLVVEQSRYTDGKTAVPPCRARNIVTVARKA